MTPPRLAKMFLGLQNICWRCGSDNATIVIYGGITDLLKSFWKQIRQILGMLGVDIPFMPECLLLHPLTSKFTYCCSNFNCHHVEIFKVAIVLSGKLKLGMYF